MFTSSVCGCTFFSISIEDAAKEEEDKMKKKTPVRSEQEQTSEETKPSSSIDSTTKHTKDGAKEEKSATAAAASSDKNTQCPSTSSSISSSSSANNKKMQLETELGKCVADETLAQLSDIEDKMNQLCTVANSLLKRKRFITLSKEEEEAKMQDGGGKDQGDEAMDVSGGKDTEDDTATKSGEDNSGTHDVDSKDSGSHVTSHVTGNDQVACTSTVCVNTSMPPVEDSVDNDESKMKGSNSAITTIDGGGGGKDDEEKPISKYTACPRKSRP